MYGIYDGGSVVAEFVTPMIVRSNRPVFVADTLSLNRQVSRHSAQRWEIETKLMPMSDGAQALFVSLVTQGYSQNVTVLMPQNYGAIKARTATGAATVGTGTAGTNSAGLTGITGLIPKGTFVKFSNFSKIYMTTADYTSGSISLYPNLINTVTGQTMTYSDDVQGTFLYDLDTISGMVYSDGILMDVGTIKLIERLP